MEEHVVRMQRVDELAGAFRNYELVIVTDPGALLEAVCVEVRYGRIGETMQVQRHYFESIKRAKEYVDGKVREKQRRGYRAVAQDGGAYRTDCFFCRLLHEPKSDPCYVATLSSTTFIVGWDQSHPGRSILVLNKHVPDFFRVSPQEMLRMQADIKVAERMIAAVFSPDMMNYLFMGNVAKHAHLHLVPRYASDPNYGKSPFLDTARVSEPSLEEDQYREIPRRLRSAAPAPLDGRTSCREEDR